MQSSLSSAQKVKPNSQINTKESIGDWLISQGVSQHHSERFQRQSRCQDLADVTLLLRFELAPLQLANNDNINMDMRRLFGCSPKVALRLITALDIFSMHRLSAVQSNSF
jgi:hypothetical protein